MTLNAKQLFEVAHKSPSAQEVLKELLKRERNQAITNLQQLYMSVIQNGGKLVPKEFDEAIAELAKTGAGTIIHSTTGGANYFKWNYNLLNVVRMMNEGEKALETTKIVPESPKEVPKRRRGRPAGSPNRQKVGVPSPVQVTGDIIVALPSGRIVTFSKEEFEVLKKIAS